MKDLFKESYVQKTIAILILFIGLYLLKDVLNLILLTFLFSFLFYSVYRFLEKRIQLNSKLLIFLIYGAFLSIVFIVAYRYAPIVVKQIGEILMQLMNFQLSDYKDSINPKIYEVIKDVNIGQHVRDSASHVVASIANISGFALQLVLGFLLSFFFILDNKKNREFMSKFQHSKAGFLYNVYKEFGQNFVNTFGKVIQVQFLIALANAILSFIGLWILGFPQLIGLTIMIFFLGMIPVAGVIISLIPLSIIAFQIGGFIKVIHVLVMIAIVHALENYFLNPKLYSVKMKLPIFFTFSILIVSEQLMGVWGLLLGIPLFMFILDILKYPQSNSVQMKSKETKEEAKKEDNR